MLAQEPLVLHSDLFGLLAGLDQLVFCDVWGEVDVGLERGLEAELLTGVGERREQHFGFLLCSELWGLVLSERLIRVARQFPLLLIAL